MIKGTLLISHFFLLFFISTYPMHNQEMLIEIIKGNKKILIPLTEVAKTIKPLIPMQESTNFSIAFLRSTGEFFATYPKEILQMLGYASLLGSILWFAKSKQRFITRTGIQKLQDEQKVAIDLIKKEEDEIMTDAYLATQNFVLKKMNNSLERSVKIHSQALDVSNSIYKKLELVIEEENKNHQKLLTIQKEEARKILDNFSESRKEQVHYIHQKTKAAEDAVNSSLAEFNKSCTHYRENVTHSFNDLHGNIDKLKKKNTELSESKRLLFDDITLNINTVEQSGRFLEELTSQLSNSDELNIEELTSLIQGLEEQKTVLLSLEANTANSNCTYVFTPALEN